MMRWRALSISPYLGWGGAECRKPPAAAWVEANNQGLMDSAWHVIECHLNHETMVYNVEDDLAGNICQRHIM